MAGPLGGGRDLTPEGGGGPEEEAVPGGEGTPEGKALPDGPWDAGTTGDAEDAVDAGIGVACDGAAVDAGVGVACDGVGDESGVVLTGVSGLAGDTGPAGAVGDVCVRGVPGGVVDGEAENDVGAMVGDGDAETGSPGVDCVGTVPGLKPGGVGVAG